MHASAFFINIYVDNRGKTSKWRNAVWTNQKNNHIFFFRDKKQQDKKFIQVEQSELPWRPFWVF